MAHQGNINLAILGAGRIGRVHARAISANDRATLAAISDPMDEIAAEVAGQFDTVVRGIDDIVADPAVDGVVICTPTDLHAEQIEICARAGKAVFCEKPIDLDADRVRACLQVVDDCDASLMVGFNRRFDPHFMGLKKTILEGRIGKPEMGVITSRDPGAPPADYIKRSGGIFRDMMIHDFDMAVFLMGDLPESVMATGSVLTDPDIEPLGDYDSATAILRWADGRQIAISNSRRAVYGYDQRIEIHGSDGMVTAQNEYPLNIEVATSSGYQRPPLHDFFMTRYVAAYANEIDAFIASMTQTTPEVPNGRDGLNALLIADAALQSAQSGQLVRIFG